MLASKDDQDVLVELASGPGRNIGKRLTLFDADGRRAVYLGPTPVYVYDLDDKEAEAACIATLSRAGLASDVEIAAGFGVHRNTVGRIAQRFEREGMAAVVPAKRGPKAASKVTPEVSALVAAHCDLPGRELRERIGRSTGVWLSLPYVYELAAPHRPHQLALTDATDAPVEASTDAVDEVSDEAVDETDADNEDIAGDDIDGAEIAADGVADEEIADQGGAQLELAHYDPTHQIEIDEPLVSLPHAVSGRYMGLALYYPALAATGLLEIARSLFSLPRSLRFGVRAITVSLFFMTVLSKTTLEGAKHLRRREFGALVGCGRAPCVKTLRRKLAELVTQSRAAELGVALARRWAESGLVATAYLYVDGHMKVYSGKRRLQEVWNSQRRMPLPAIHSYYVGDNAARPLLFLSEELSANLAKAMPRIVAAIREVIGERRFTVIFDRGGYDGKLFRWLAEQKIDFITYQKGTVALPKNAFRRHECRVGGRRRRFMIAEDTKKVGRSGPWRRIVVRVNDAHQTPILTSLGPELGPARVAVLMFARWGQENFFKYMGAHHGIDDIVSYAYEPAAGDLMVPSPARKAIDRRLGAARKELSALKATLGDALLAEPKDGGRSAHGLKIAQGGRVGELRALEAKVAALIAERKALPEHVPLAQSGIARDVMRREAKSLVDRIKISAYNAEEWLLERLSVHYRNPHDVRDLLRSFAELSGTITTTTAGVVVSLDPPDTPAHREALRGLVADLNAGGVTFPGTDVAVTYRVKVHHSELFA